MNHYKMMPDIYSEEYRKQLEGTATAGHAVPSSIRGIHIKSTRATPENPYKKHPRNSGEPI